MNNEKQCFYVLLAQRSVNDPIPGSRKIIKISSNIPTPILWEETPMDEGEGIPGLAPVKVRTLFLCLGLN
jgi:hypothetical protein